MSKKLVLAVAVCGLMGAAGVVNAAVIMDATTHNGNFADGAYATFWSNGVGNPPEWSKSGRFVYNGAYGQYLYNDTQVFNNTGEQVIANHEYTLSAALGDHLGNKLDVYVRATENADGTGASAELAHVSRTGTSPGYSNFNFYTETATGAPAAASLAGYYIQVSVESGPVDDSFYYWIKSVQVTSALAVPEPATISALALGGVMLVRRRRI